MKSIQAEDRGIYKCTIEQSRGSKSIMTGSQSIEVKVKGKIRKNILSRLVEASIQEKKLPVSDYICLLVQF